MNLRTVVNSNCPESEVPTSPLATGISAPALVKSAEPLVRLGAFSILDQAIVSGTNFLTMLILARACSQEELGIYSLAWTVVLFLAAAQANLVSVPYTMYCHRRTGEALADYAGSAMVHQLMTSLAAVVCFLGLDLVLAFGIGPERLRLAAWVLLAAVPFILQRDYARRFSFAHMAIGTAIFMDLLVAGLQLAGLVFLWRVKWISAASGYAAVGAACAAACAAWWLLNRQPIRFSRRGLAHDWLLNWSFGKWALTSQIAGLAFYALPWILAAVHGEAATGEFAACTTLVGLSNLFVIGMNNFLMPKAAQAYNHWGAQALGSLLWKAVCASLAVLGSLCVAVFFVGNLLAGLLFGSPYADTGFLMTILAVAALCDAVGLTAGTGLWAIDRPAANLVADLAQMCVTLVAALTLVAPYGAVGIAIAIVVGRVAGAALRWVILGTCLIEACAKKGEGAVSSDIADTCRTAGYFAAENQAGHSP